jgi:hypothetical protein
VSESSDTDSGTDRTREKEPGTTDGDDPSDAEVACFEAGVKFGTLYHQFTGTPLSVASADSLARAMEEAIENQPYCAAVTVHPRINTLETALAGQSAEYTEWTGRFAEVEMTIEYEGVEVASRMAMAGDYPLMSVERVQR